MASKLQLMLLTMLFGLSLLAIYLTPVEGWCHDTRDELKDENDADWYHVDLLERPNVNNLPAYVNWTDFGAVTPVQNQGKCNSCWAFTAVGAIEGIIKIKTGRKLVPLSVQELVSCDKTNNKCAGGRAEKALRWLERPDEKTKKKNGLCPAEQYPYTGTATPCLNKPSTAYITGVGKVLENNETDLQRHVAQQPVTASVDFSDPYFKKYDGKVIVKPNMCGIVRNHAVLIVGYGTSQEGVKYWLIKNSWGKQWGEGGYARLERGVSQKEGSCGLAMKPYYPTIDGTA